MSTLSRLKEYVEQQGITVTYIEREIGVSKGSIARQLKSGKAIGVDKVENILLAHPDINPTWLLTGKGEMLLNSDEKSVSGIEKTKECEKCEILEKENDFLKQIIKAKEETIRAYQSNENNNNNKEESKGRNSA